MDRYETLKYKNEAGLVTITMNRIREANGLNVVMAHELAEAAGACDMDSSVRAVILTGSGRFFCSGGDVKSMAALNGRMAFGVKDMVDNLHRAISTFARMNAPLIVAVNGAAAGAGFSLAIAADLVVAGRSASFTMAYTKVGLSPDGSSSYYLPRLVGVRKAQELMYTNKILTADEALSWGLINEVVADEELIAKAKSLAEIFLRGSRESNAAVKKLLLQTFDNGLETQMEMERRLIVGCAGSESGHEGVRAFMEKRNPEFK